MGRGQAGGSRGRLAGGGSADRAVTAQERAQTGQYVDPDIAQDSLIDGLEGQPLTPEERDAFINYTTPQYRELNSYLGQYPTKYGPIPKWSDLTDTQKSIHANLPTALSKLPAYKGTTYRTIEISQARMSKFIKDYKVGEGVEIKNYMSSSIGTAGKYGAPSGKSIVDGGGASGIVVYTIKGKRGRDIRNHSSIGGAEGEVLFTHGSRFKVTGVTALPKGGYHIELEQ